MRASLQTIARRWSCIALPAFLLGTACGKTTEVHVLIKVEDERFRPDHVDLVWISPPDDTQRTARIPSQGSLPTTGTDLASVLITLDDGYPGDRRFVARGFNGDARIAGANGSSAWQSGSEATVTLTLGPCYEDPDPGKFPPLPTCSAAGNDSDGSAPDTAGPQDGGGDRPRG